MKVVSNEARTITIEGVAFTPDPKGVTIPEGKVAKMKSNFFYKHYVEIGSFKEIAEQKANDEAKKANDEAKAVLQAELTELGVEFNANLGVKKLQALLDEAKEGNE